uniref:Putative FBD-associated F-box protein n=1 Tax=Noccaea caerulescens TaxID=107243 RepID=A0A1J3HXT2_NOCCA
MALMRISDLSDDLLIKILSFLPTKVAVSTSILSKQWQFLWMWLPKLEYDDSDIAKPLSSWLRYEEFIDKKLPLHRAPVLETLLLSFVRNRLSQPEKIKLWVEIAVSRFVREVSVGYFNSNEELFLSLPSSLYAACDSLMALKLEGKNILVDVPPRTVYLPCLKTLQLRCVTYANEASLPLLLSHCPVLEDLFIERDDEDDNVGVIVVNVPSLQRLSLEIDGDCSSDDEYVIVTYLVAQKFS